MSTSLPPLDKLEPQEAWQPWQPSADEPWDLKWAAHFFRRAGFGAPSYVPGQSTWEALQQAVQQGHEATLAGLFDAGEAATDYDRVMDQLAPGTGTLQRSFDPNAEQPLTELQAWWLHRMLHTPFPLRERLTLFWHNHFATSIAKVRLSALMVRQNQLIREHALGKFAPFVLAMSKDPAMLLWLDSNSNVKGKPNENYARELMELFTLGVGNYTEKDIREAARAFTGWHSNVPPNQVNYYPPQAEPGPRFVFVASQHDGGEKTICGQTGNWDGGDVIRILLEHPAAARFLVRKLYREFISEGTPPPERLLEPLAERFRKSEYDIAGVVRTMLSSRLFFSQHAYRQRIKSPVELVVGLARAIDVQNAAGMSTVLAQALEPLGQRIFAPPNVKGWEGGKQWLNSATVVARHNFAWSFLGENPNRANEMRYRGYSDGQFAAPRVDPRTLMQPVSGKDGPAQLSFLLDLFLQGDVEPATRERLAGHWEKPAAGFAEKAKRLREVVHTILSMPEYQLA